MVKDSGENKVQDPSPSSDAPAAPAEQIVEAEFRSTDEAATPAPDATPEPGADNPAPQPPAEEPAAEEPAAEEPATDEPATEASERDRGREVLDAVTAMAGKVVHDVSEAAERAGQVVAPIVVGVAAKAEEAFNDLVETGKASLSRDSEAPAEPEAADQPEAEPAAAAPEAPAAPEGDAEAEAPEGEVESEAADGEAGAEPEAASMRERATTAANRVIHELSDMASKAEQAVVPVARNLAGQAGRILNDIVGGRGDVAAPEESEPAPEPAEAPAEATRASSEPADAPADAPEPEAAEQAPEGGGSRVRDRAARLASMVAEEVTDAAVYAKQVVDPMVGKVRGKASEVYQNLRGSAEREAAPEGQEAPEVVEAKVDECKPSRSEVFQQRAGAAAGAAMEQATRVAQNLGQAAQRAEKVVSPMVATMATRAGGILGDLLSGRRGEKDSKGDE